MATASVWRQGKGRDRDRTETGGGANAEEDAEAEDGEGAEAEEAETDRENRQGVAIETHRDQARALASLVNTSSKPVIAPDPWST